MKSKPRPNRTRLDTPFLGAQENVAQNVVSDFPASSILQDTNFRAGAGSRLPECFTYVAYAWPAGFPLSGYTLAGMLGGELPRAQSLRGAAPPDGCGLGEACLTTGCPDALAALPPEWPRTGEREPGRSALILQEAVSNIDPLLFVVEVPTLRPVLLSSSFRVPGARANTESACDPAGWRSSILAEDLERIDAMLRTSGWHEHAGVVEYRAAGSGGAPRWFECRYYPLPGPGAARVCGMVLDVSAHKHREAQLESRVAERETALREIHHRVKNNLQIVSSFLDLQAASLPPEACDGIGAAQQRIRTMALLHEQLHSSPDPSHLDVETYFRELAGRVLASTRPQFTLEVEIDVRGTVLSVDEVIPCGLILNELLQNAAKHGYPGQETGHVRMSFALAASDLVLEVGDQGRGLPDGFELRDSRSLGLRVVQALARQLRGEVTTPSRRPAVFRLRFPAPGGSRP